MPKYIIFLIIAGRPGASESKTSKQDDEATYKDPEFQKTLAAFLDWIKEEFEARRITDGNVLLDASEDTNIRIDFFSPGPEAIQKKDDAAPETKEGETSLPPPKSSVKRGVQDDVSTSILTYYIAEFPTLNEAIAWGQSCPISFDGLALEIRQLQDLNAAVEEAPQQVREWSGDTIMNGRKRLLEEGKMRRDEDGTLWVKVEDPEGVSEIVAEAEEREAKKEEA